MAFHVRDKETDTLVRKLAEAKGLGLTDAIRLAVRSELRRAEVEERQREADIQRLLDTLDRTPRTGQTADKAFFDELSGD